MITKPRVPSPKRAPWVLTAIALVMAVGALLATPGPAQAQEPLVLATGPDYKPFTDPSLPAGGLATEMVQAVLDRAGLAHGLQWVPWKRAETGAAEGTYDATFPYFKTPERATVFHYSDPVFTVEARLFARQDAPDATSVEDLEGRILCSPLGYAVARSLEPAVAEDRIGRAMPLDMTKCFRMLDAGRVDMVESNPLQGWDLVESLGYDRTAFKMLTFVADRKDLHFIVSRAHPRATELLDAFNRALAEMRDDGSYDAIVARHLGS